MKSFTVTENTFSPSETRDIINAIIKAKINFYKIKNLRSSYCYDCEDEGVLAEIQRLEALKSSFQQAMREGNNDTDLFIKINMEVSTEVGTQKKISNRLATAVA